MRGLIASLGLGLVGCAFDGGSGAVFDAPGGGDDAPGTIDAFPGDGPSGCDEWLPVPHHFNPCAIPAPGEGWTVPQTLSPHTYDTDADTYDGQPLSAIIGEGHTTIIAAGGVEARLVSVDDFKVNANARLEVVGTRGLIIASWTTIEIDGILDASSTGSGRIGAGAQPAGLCNAAGQGGGADKGGGSGGGGGGGFGAGGGEGGLGDSPPSQAAGGTGAAMVAVPEVVRGGCAGAASGAAGPGSVTPDAVAAGGAGGGAIQLTARDEIHVAGGGRVLAGGAGGRGASPGTACGGGGGGSGGYLGFDSPRIRLDGRALANGGGGGASQTFDGGQFGDHGDDAHEDNDDRAVGGASNACAPAGGVGSGDLVLDGGMGSSGSVVQGCGGGGGGGAAGYIRVWSGNFTMAGDTVISPPRQ